MKIIFLDRDGVINEYPGDKDYVKSWEEFRFIPGAKYALKKLNDRGFKIFIISNQAGVAKAILSQQDLDSLTRKMLRELKKLKINIRGVYYCTHHPDDNCPCRKPKSGLIKKALKEHNIPRSILKQSFFIGDSIQDVKTGKSVGCKTILVFSGKEKIQNQENWETRPDFAAKDLSEAMELVLSDKKLKINENIYRLCLGRQRAPCCS